MTIFILIILLDLRNVCTEAGMFAIRDDREYVIQEDFAKAVRKVADAKKLESKLIFSSYGSTYFFMTSNVNN